MKKALIFLFFFLVILCHGQNLDTTYSSLSWGDYSVKIQSISLDTTLNMIHNSFYPKDSIRFSKPRISEKLIFYKQDSVLNTAKSPSFRQGQVLQMALSSIAVVDLRREYVYLVMYYGGCRYKCPRALILYNMKGEWLITRYIHSVYPYNYLVHTNEDYNYTLQDFEDISDCIIKSKMLILPFDMK